MAALLWTALLTALSFVVASIALIGDCPEKVISGWHGGTACSDQKRGLAWSILTGFSLLWLLGTFCIFRLRSR